MSSATPPPGGDPTGGAGMGFDPYAGGQPSEEQVQQMLAQMRVLPVDQHLAQVFQLLLEGAQVKIGRNDGRLLLDATGALTEYVKPYANADLVGQVEEALAQLRMAQVQAEGQLQRAAVEEGHVEANDLPTPPRAPGQPASAPTAEPGEANESGESDPSAATPPPAQAPQPPPPSRPAASRLWTPGT